MAKDDHLTLTLKIVIKKKDISYKISIYQQFIKNTQFFCSITDINCGFIDVKFPLHTIISKFKNRFLY